ncbi:MAG: hypothetical protein AAB576_06190 [Elusimicrobiota bacterium]
MKNIRFIAAAAFALAASVPASAEELSLDFDRGLDVSAIVSAAREDAKKEASAPEAKPVQAASIRATRDCVRFAFGLEGAAVSEPAWLSSTEYIEECRNIPGNPREGGGHRDCWERPGFTHREKVQVKIDPRLPVFPWEREVVEVCLEGHWLDAFVVKGAYEYKIQEAGGLFTLLPGKRLPMDPDSAGISAEAPLNHQRSIALAFKDKWASFYKGEKTLLTVALKQEVPGWFDTTIVEKEIPFPGSESYFVDFGSLIIDKLKTGKKYYVKWSFKRVGKISTEKQVDRGETTRVVYSPSSALQAFSW